ncbi:hypothetical protein PIB30_103995, partial [Stylosanthes scabra]|nr:hypothetical protein [Stylosanthes scabra]
MLVIVLIRSKSTRNSRSDFTVHRPNFTVHRPKFTVHRLNFIIFTPELTSSRTASFQLMNGLRRNILRWIFGFRFLLPLPKPATHPLRFADSRPLIAAPGVFVLLLPPLSLLSSSPAPTQLPFLFLRRSFFSASVSLFFFRS